MVYTVITRGSLQPSVHNNTFISYNNDDNNVFSIMRWQLALHHEEGHPVFVSIYLAVRSTNALL